MQSYDSLLVDRDRKIEIEALYYMVTQFQDQSYYQLHNNYKHLLRHSLCSNLTVKRFGDHDTDEGMRPLRVFSLFFLDLRLIQESFPQV